MVSLKQKEDYFFSTFKEINHILKKYEIKAWVDAGILLKHYRKQNIFPSSDIDFGIKSRDLKNIMHFVNNLKAKNYEVTTLGNSPLLFEGLSIQKIFSNNFVINIDIYVYYSVKNFFCRPNMHKPLKQDYFSVFLFILLNKFNQLKLNGIISNFNLLNYIFSKIILILSWIYFRFAQTTQFAIPFECLNELIAVEKNDNNFLIPKNTKEYIIWRYGPKWKIPNKNWRLTDGNMVFLNNLKLFWGYYTKAKKFKIITIKTKVGRPGKNSIFKFSKKEVIKIKKSKIKSHLY